MIFGIITLTIIVLSIGIAYYYDYKSNPKEFSLSIKTLGKGIFKGLVYAGFLIGWNAIYELVIPFNKNHGIEFNTEREKLGIPKIGNTWVNSKYDSDQYTVSWWNDKKSDRHFKKIIKYGIVNAKSEKDYYKNENKEGIYVWSEYNYTNETFEYFIEKPNDKVVSVTENGRMKFEKPRVEEKINKPEFEKFISE